ncbi:MAG TPA: hypothetical protein VI356_06790 [Myxococcales bacterium]
MRTGWTSAATVAATALLLWPAAARAQIETSFTPSGDTNWSATAGRTAGDGNSILQAEAGWPGIGLTWLKGVDERTDLGVHVGFNYGLENTSNNLVGFNFAIPYRHTLGSIGDTTFAFQAQPGVSLYGNNGVLFAAGGPVGVVAGLRVSPRMTLDLGADVPVLISFTNPTGFLVGPQFGGGGEYLLDNNLAVTARVRIGPQFALDSSGTGAQTGFITLVGLAYNAR